MNTGELDFILNTTFHYVEPRVRTIYGINNEPISVDSNEFWWRSCVLKDDMEFGEQGYLMVWWDGDKLTTHHTYRNPEDM